MVIFFSGNGNSKAIAVSISEALNQSILDLRGEILNNPHTFKYAPHSGEPIIWVFPVYSWGIPPVVTKFIKNSRIDCTNNTHYLVLTCGDDCGMTARQWTRLITRRGWKARGKASIFMPNTYVLMKGFDIDSKEVASKKIEDSKEKIKNIVQKINNDFNTDDTFHGSFAWLKSKIVYPWFIRYSMSPRKFSHNDKCISCGKCVKSCPLNNILMVDNYPVWNNNCAMCLACYHICPKKAVTYGKITYNKGQYTYPLKNNAL